MNNKDQKPSVKTETDSLNFNIYLYFDYHKLSDLFLYHNFININIYLTNYQHDSHSKSLEVFLRWDRLPHLLVLRLGGVDGVAGVLRHQLTLAPHLRPLQTGGGRGVVSPCSPSENISLFPPLSCG